MIMIIIVSTFFTCQHFWWLFAGDPRLACPLGFLSWLFVWRSVTHVLLSHSQQFQG